MGPKIKICSNSCTNLNRSNTSTYIISVISTNLNSQYTLGIHTQDSTTAAHCNNSPGNYLILISYLQSLQSKILQPQFNREHNEKKESYKKPFITIKFKCKIVMAKTEQIAMTIHRCRTAILLILLCSIWEYTYWRLAEHKCYREQSYE